MATPNWSWPVTQDCGARGERSKLMTVTPNPEREMTLLLATVYDKGYSDLCQQITKLACYKCGHTLGK